MISPSALRSLRLVRVHCKRARSVRCLSSEPGQGAQIDTTTPNGKLMFSIFASLAEYERELIRERTKAGMRAARRSGKRVGRPGCDGMDAPGRHLRAKVVSIDHLR